MLDRKSGTSSSSFVVIFVMVGFFACLMARPVFADEPNIEPRNLPEISEGKLADTIKQIQIDFFEGGGPAQMHYQCVTGAKKLAASLPKEVKVYLLSTRPSTTVVLYGQHPPVHAFAVVELTDEAGEKVYYLVEVSWSQFGKKGALALPELVKGGYARVTKELWKRYTRFMSETYDVAEARFQFTTIEGVISDESYLLVLSPDLERLSPEELKVFSDAYVEVCNSGACADAGTHFETELARKVEAMKAVEDFQNKIAALRGQELQLAQRRLAEAEQDLLLAEDVKGGAHPFVREGSSMATYERAIEEELVNSIPSLQGKISNLKSGIEKIQADQAAKFALAEAEAKAKLEAVAKAAEDACKPKPAPEPAVCFPEDVVKIAEAIKNSDAGKSALGLGQDVVDHGFNVVIDIKTGDIVYISAKPSGMDLAFTRALDNPKNVNVIFPVVDVNGKRIIGPMRQVQADIAKRPYLSDAIVKKFNNAVKLINNPELAKDCKLKCVDPPAPALLDARAAAAEKLNKAAQDFGYRNAEAALKDYNGLIKANKPVPENLEAFVNGKDGFMAQFGKGSVAAEDACVLDPADADKILKDIVGQKFARAKLDFDSNQEKLKKILGDRQAVVDDIKKQTGAAGSDVQAKIKLAADQAKLEELDSTLASQQAVVDEMKAKIADFDAKIAQEDARLLSLRAANEAAQKEILACKDAAPICADAGEAAKALNAAKAAYNAANAEFLIFVDGLKSVEGSIKALQAKGVLPGQALLDELEAAKVNVGIGAEKVLFAGTDIRKASDGVRAARAACMPVVPGVVDPVVPAAEFVGAGLTTPITTDVLSWIVLGKDFATLSPITAKVVGTFGGGVGQAFVRPRGDCAVCVHGDGPVVY